MGNRTRHNYAVGGSRRYTGDDYEHPGHLRNEPIGAPSRQAIAKSGPVRTWAQMSEAERDAIRRATAK